MPPTVQAKCPGCQQVLHLPADWVHQTVRCKHCGRLLQARRKPAANTAPPSSQPVPAAPADSGIPFPALDAGPILRTPSYRRSTGSRWIGVLLAVGLLVATAVGALGAYFYGDQFLAWWTGHQRPQASTSAGSNDPAGEGKSLAGLPAGRAFPRRALLIAVSNYLYANPVSYGLPGHNVYTLQNRLATTLHLPLTQVVHLSDAAPDPLARPPLKSVVEKTVADFLDGCRAQDRILLLFIGHAVMLDDKAYLVPLEGELTVKETLLPLDWLYERLERCKARQKVLVLDVCRLDPGRGVERAGSGPMSAALAAALQKPPAGVQVWTACAAEQYSYEFDGAGVFLDKLFESLQPGALKRSPQPSDPLPVDALAESISRSTEAEVQAQQKAKQTPRLVGQEPAEGAPYDPKEPLPARLIVSPPTPLADNRASPSDVQGILQEIDLPPLRPGQGDVASLKLEALLPFAANVLEAYRPDYSSVEAIRAEPAKYPLRVAVLEVLDLLRKAGQSPLREKFRGGGNPDRIKKEILKEQEQPARLTRELKEALDLLEEAGRQRATEPSPRWQAHYHYVHAQLLARLAYVHEYNLMLGKIRLDELPELTPNVHQGWQMAARAKLQSGKEVRDWAAKSRQVFAELAKDHPGTPWEVLAKRERLTALGLEWQPAR
jgi:hypothetical protein